MTGKYLHCVYAEDIRQEVSGQFSMIGCFQGGVRLLKSDVLPKIAIKADLFIPTAESPGSAALRIQIGDEVLQMFEVPQELFDSARGKAQLEEDAHGLGVQLLMTFTNLKVERTSKLKAFAVVDGVEIRGNALRIEVCNEEPAT